MARRPHEGQTCSPHRRTSATYTRDVGDDSARPACGPVAWWWFGGFSLAGTLIALLMLAPLLGSRPFLAFLGIAVLGAIVGLLVGLGIAEALVLITDSLGWDEKPRSFRLGRLVQCLDQLIHHAGQW